MFFRAEIFSRAEGIVLAQKSFLAQRFFLHRDFSHAEGTEVQSFFHTCANGLGKKLE